MGLFKNPLPYIVLLLPKTSGALIYSLLRGYVYTQPYPNLSILAMRKMPSNAGKNLSDRKFQHKRKAGNEEADVFVLCPALGTSATHQTTKEIVATTEKQIRLLVTYLLHCICAHLIHLHPALALQWRLLHFGVIPGFLKDLY